MRVWTAFRKILRKTNTEKFNSRLFLFAWFWLIITIPIGIILRPTVPDFGQFYMGGVIARSGEWSSLYPIPNRRSLDNPGLKMHSRGKPKWLVLSRSHRVQDYTHFILPPPAALLFIPFSFFSYTQAFWIWTYILLVCTWATGYLAAKILQKILNRPTHYEGLLCLLVVMSPMTARAIRISNVSPPIALIIGIVVFSLVREERPGRNAAGLLIGALLKYATLVLVPILVAMRRWKTLFCLSLLGSVVFLLALSIAGSDVFIEFFTSISPTLSRPSGFKGNQSLPGMLARIFGRPLDHSIELVLNVLRSATLLACLYFILKLRPKNWKNPVNVCSAASLLISWLLVFSPITWEHWPIFLCPFWGWILWESQTDLYRRTLAFLSFFLMYIPAGILQVDGIAQYPILLPEPLNSSQLFGIVFLFILSLSRVSRPIEVTQTTDHAENLVSAGSELDRLKPSKLGLTA